jgi:catechol 2,3-dioxygenase-like lactoylglutathione lyase family enzyme
MATTELTHGLAHIGLTVKDLHASQAFFEAIGFKKFGEDPSYPAVFLKDAHGAITLWAHKEEPHVEFDRKRNIGLHHFGIRVGSQANLEALLHTVKHLHGVTVETEIVEVASQGLHQFAVYEPSGIRVTFVF